MKKLYILASVLFFIIVLVGCDKQEMTYVSKPVGYALLSDTYVGKGSLIYRSEHPYNVNQLSLVLYYLPSVWGEIEITENQLISENDPSLLIINYNTESQKVFAKYIHIGVQTWTAELDNSQVKYVNQDGDSVLELLSDETQAKAYVEALEIQDAYFLDNEMPILSGYRSKLDTIDADVVIQRVSEVKVIEILWADTISSFPDLSSHFPDYNGNEINTLFQRAFNKAEELEYRTNVFVK